MSVKTTQVAKIHSSWENELGEGKIDALNEDLETMGANIRVYYKATPDGWLMRFIKETEED